MKHYRQTPAADNGGDAFTAACQRGHAIANACLNWLNIATSQPLRAVHAENGCTRSIRLARLKPVSHEVTPQSALLLVVMPAAFDDPRHRGYDHPQWQLMIYSWLDRDTNARLMAHLQGKADCHGIRFFQVSAKANTCIRKCNK